MPPRPEYHPPRGPAPDPGYPARFQLELNRWELSLRLSWWDYQLALAEWRLEEYRQERERYLQRVQRQAEGQPPTLADELESPDPRWSPEFLASLPQPPELQIDLSQATVAPIPELPDPPRPIFGAALLSTPDSPKGVLVGIQRFDPPIPATPDLELQLALHRFVVFEPTPAPAIDHLLTVSAPPPGSRGSWYFAPFALEPDPYPKATLRDLPEWLGQRNLPTRAQRDWIGRRWAETLRHLFPRARVLQ